MSLDPNLNNHNNYTSQYVNTINTIAYSSPFMNNSGINSITSSTNTAAQDVFCELDVVGNAIIYDHTNGLAKVECLNDSAESLQSIYQISIKGKELILPVNTREFLTSDERFLLGGSHKIVLSKEENFLKITEEDHQGTHEYFVDLDKKIFISAYEVFNAKPTPITNEMALKKCAKVLSEKQSCSVKFMAFNQYGVGLVVVDQVNYRNQFFWAKPNDAEVTGIPYHVYTRKACFNIQSDDGFVDFLRLNGVATINGEVAQIFKIINKEQNKG